MVAVLNLSVLIILLYWRLSTKSNIEVKMPEIDIGSRAYFTVEAVSFNRDVINTSNLT